MSNIEENNIDFTENKSTDNTDEIEIIEDVNEKVSKELEEANKFLGLLDAFELEADGLEDNLKKRKQEIDEKIKQVPVLNDSDTLASIVKSDELLTDFDIVKQALREDIQTTKEILSKLGKDLAVSHSEEVSGSVLMAYAELKKGNVTSMKLLMDSYSTVAETQLKVKKFLNAYELEKQNDEKTVNIQNNFIGDTASLLSKIQSGEI